MRGVAESNTLGIFRIDYAVADQRRRAYALIVSIPKANTRTVMHTYKVQLRLDWCSVEKEHCCVLLFPLRSTVWKLHQT